MPRPNRPNRPLSRRNGLLSVIHIRRKQLGISDPEYRDFLWEHFEVVSAAALEEEGLDELLRCLDRWNRPNAASEKSSRFIWVLWKQYLCPLLRPRERTDEYLTGVANNAAGTALTTPDFDALCPSERRKIIEALKRRIRQNGGDPP